MRFYFLGHLFDRDGYGYGGMQVVQALKGQVGADVVEVNMLVDGDWSLPGERRWGVPGAAVAMCVPDWWGDIDAAGGLIGFTMFESTRMPAERVEAINREARVCLVPCRWCAEMFEAQGVRRPIRVVRWGVSGVDYPMVARQRGDSPYTFLWSGTPDYRKGWDVAYRAFVAAFGKRRDVRLVLHFRKRPRGVMGFTDRNVEMMVGMFYRADLLRMLTVADCFVFPSRGEGWGLPPREAAATGMPVIATDWGGLAEEIVYWGLPLAVKGMSQAAFGPWDAGEVGEWAEPDFDHLVELMRWCEGNRDEAAEWGWKAGVWMQEHGRWERTARGVMEAVREFGGDYVGGEA